jgi:hypothetical protein
MTEKKDVPSTIFVPGSHERLPDRANTFRVPLHRLLADRVIRQHGPRLFESISEEPIRIEDGEGRVEIVLTKGAFFVSITWDYEQEWHNCFLDFSKKR